jgi:hypothetical protein
MKRLVVFAAGLLLVGGWYAQAQPIATLHMSGSGGAGAIASGMTLEIGYGGGSNSVALFDSVLWTPAMVGQTVLYSAGSGSSYDTFLSLATDGVNEFAYWENTLVPGGGAGMFGAESLLFTTHPASWNGIDLHGYAIGGISLELNTLSLQSQGNWTDYSFDALVTYYAVPEPAVESLLLLGCLGGWCWSRRRVRGVHNTYRNRTLQPRRIAVQRRNPTRVGG